MSSNLGILWIVATPLGNPGDLSVRAREILGSVDGILAEDTRRAGSLFARCGIPSSGFTSLHDHNEEARIPQVIARLTEGQSLALVSDAGTPLLSDPGYRLVRACREAGIRVSPVPGPSAPVTALSASGIAPLPFIFLGFAPRKDGERDSFFAPYASLDVTIVFFERKDRLRATLQNALDVLGPREGCIARELTKSYEEFIPFSLDSYKELPEELLGEITVVIGPPKRDERSSTEEALAVLQEESASGMKPKETARNAAARLRGWSGKELYKLLQEHSSGGAR